MTEARFADQSAIVTGAGSGIGFEIARQLASEGAGIVLNDIDEEVAFAAVNKIRSAGGRCQAVVGDSSDLECIQQMVQQALDSYGKLDLAVANASITTYGDFLDYPVEQFQRLITVNLQGTFYLAQKAARQMIAQKNGGRMVFMSSVTGHQYHPGLVAYGMSKAGMRMLAKSLGAELAPHDITVNAISPGATLTERTTVMEGGDYSQLWAGVTPTGRAATTQDVAHTALFLLSRATSHITGQTIVVDGGWTTYSPTPESN